MKREDNVKQSETNVTTTAANVPAMIETKELSTDNGELTLTMDEANALLDEPTTLEERVASMGFATANPKLKAYVLKLPKLEGTRMGMDSREATANFLNGVYYHIANKEKSVWTPKKIKLVQKASNNSEVKYLGQYNVEGYEKLQQEVKFLPLVYSYSNFYWPTDMNSDVKLLCRSMNCINGAYYAVKNSPRILSCDKCEYQAFEKDAMGKWKKLRCTKVFSAFGLTKDFDGLYQIDLKGKSVGGKVNMDGKVITGARMLNQFEIKGGSENLGNYPVGHAPLLDSFSRWLLFTGKAEQYAKGFSATAEVNISTEALTPQELFYAKLYKKVAQDYVIHSILKFEKNIDNISKGMIVTDEEQPMGVEDNIFTGSEIDVNVFAGTEG